MLETKEVEQPTKPKELKWHVFNHKTSYTLCGLKRSDTEDKMKSFDIKGITCPDCEAKVLSYI